jgi:hypothetical protein
MGMGNKDIGYLQDCGGRERGIVPQVKQNRPMLPFDIDIEARVSKRLVHQAREK